MKILSVILPVYNSARTIRRTINSLVNQTHKAEFNLIIIDNFSKDSTYEIAKKFSEQYEFISVFRRPHTVSIFDNWNFFCDYKETEYITMIHGDDYYEKNFILDIINRIKLNKPDLLIFDCNILDEESNILTTLGYNEFNQLSKKNVLSIYPGIQRQVWKSKLINYKFQNIYFPVSDYIWFFKNLKFVKRIDYLNYKLVNIETGPNQITNQIKWEFGIFKSIVLIAMFYKPIISKYKFYCLSHLVLSLYSKIRMKLK